MPALPHESSPPLTDPESARAVCRSLLSIAPFRAYSDAVERQFPPGHSAFELLEGVDEAAPTHEPVRRVVDALARSQDERTAVVRAILVRSALAALDRLPALPLPAAVIARLCEEFAAMAGGTADDVRPFTIGSSRFVRACKLTTLRRFPAGQFEWERSGISRRDLLRVELRSMPKALFTVVCRMRGLGPVFYSHLNPRRPNRSLDEHEANRSYYLMALAMERQPDVRGFAACSWFRSPATQAVSPHLAWVSRVFLENGGIVVESGRADPDCGVFHRSATRRRLYEEGRFTPTLGLVLWPRASMLAWARSHPELAG